MRLNELQVILVCFISAAALGRIVLTTCRHSTMNLLPSQRRTAKRRNGSSRAAYGDIHVARRVTLYKYSRLLCEKDHAKRRHLLRA